MAKAEECTNDMKIFMAGKTVTTSLERQTIYFSEGDCNIDAVFIRLIIAKYHSKQVLRCLVGYVPELLEC